MPTIAERLLEILALGHDGRLDAPEEIARLQYWLMVDQFDRKAVNRRLQLYASGDEAWQWDK